MNGRVPCAVVRLKIVGDRSAHTERKLAVRGWECQTWCAIRGVRYALSMRHRAWHRPHRA